MRAEDVVRVGSGLITGRVANKHAPKPAYPPIPTTLQVVLKAFRERGLEWNDFGMTRYVTWCGRYRKVLIPGRLVTYVSERHVVFPAARLHLTLRRERTYVLRSREGPVEGADEREVLDVEVLRDGCGRGRQD